MMKRNVNVIFIIFALTIGSGSTFADSHMPAHKFLMEDQKGFLKYDDSKKGSANAKILLDKGLIVMEVLSPAWNLHGVDAAPNERTKHEKEQVENETQRYINNPKKYFRFEPTRACSLRSQIYRLEQISATEGKKGEAGRWRSFDVRAEMVFGCQQASPERMAVDLFSAFPRLKELHVQLIANKGDLRRLTLTPDKPVIPITASATSK